MALRQAGLIFRAEAAASLVITPRAGEGFRVRRIYVGNVSASPAFVTCINDTARVGFFRVAGFGGNHLGVPRLFDHDQTVKMTNLLDLMTRQLGMLGYPVVQGENFTVSVNTGTADFFIVADTYDAADIASSMPQGSHSSEVMFVNYGTNLSALTTAAYFKLDNRQNPAEMVAFPFGAAGAGLVPAGKRITLLFVGGQPVGRFVSAGNTMGSQYLRFRAGTAPAATILDRNDVGYQFIGTIPGAGVDYTSIRSSFPSAPDPFAPDLDIVPNMDFNSNDELALQLSTVIVGAGQLNAGDADVWVIERVFTPGA
jgi:hypothetical protein